MTDQELRRGLASGWRVHALPSSSARTSLRRGLNSSDRKVSVLLKRLPILRRRRLPDDLLGPVANLSQQLQTVRELLRRLVDRLLLNRIQKELLEEVLKIIRIPRVNRGSLRRRDSIGRRARGRHKAHPLRRSRSRFGILRVFLR